MSTGAWESTGAWQFAQAKFLYDEIDTDHSGTITYPEFARYMKKHETGHGGQHLTDEQRHEIFELMDLDHSGAINRKEFEQCRKDCGGEWTVAKFSDIIRKLKSKTPHGSCPTSPTARSRGSSPTALARPLNGSLPTSPTARSLKASTPNGRVTSETAMRPNGCLSVRSRPLALPVSLPFSVYVCVAMSLSESVRLACLLSLPLMFPPLSSSCLLFLPSRPLFLLPFVTPLTFSRGGISPTGTR
jgi:hypothetical protein